MNIAVVGSNSIVLPAECVVINITVGMTGSDREGVVRETHTLAQLVRGTFDAMVTSQAAESARLSALRTWSSIPYDDEGKPKAPLHTTQIRGSLTIKNLSRVAALVGELISHDGIDVENVNWKLSDETLTRVQPEVLRGAFESAKQRARWIADAAGMGRLEVAAIDNNDMPSYGSGQPRLARMASASAGAPHLELDPEDVEVSATLRVEFSCDS